MLELQKNIFISPADQSACSWTSASNTYDLAIVGSGVSCAYTLIHYISLLKEKFAQQQKSAAIKTIRAVVLDKSAEFWTGIPYGSRSGTQSLIITPLKEFLPQPERDRFIDWLRDNYATVVSSLRQRPGILNSKWLESYQESIAQNDWDELFLPRYIFGWYLKERIDNVLQEAQEQSYLQCELISANVSNIQKLATGYQIDGKKYSDLDITDRISLRASKVVLAIGSPPNKAGFMSKLEALEDKDNNICCIANMYEPSQNSNIESIRRCLEAANPGQPKQVLIVGSNASALETIYSLTNLPEVGELIDKFVVISPSGAFPHRITNNPPSTDYVAQNLTSLVKQKDFTAKQIYEAVQQDVQAVFSQNETINDTYQAISQGVINALNQLIFSEQKQFVIKYGVEIGKFQRRAGADYLNIVEKLIFQGKLQFIKGKFAGTITLGENKHGFKFITPMSSQPEVFTSPIQAIINCAGFQDLTKSSSTLINNLIQQGICIPNDSNCGFKMNENFEADENFYLMGPLVAGNINNKLKVWHAESCGRIFNLSKDLASSLL